MSHKLLKHQDMDPRLWPGLDSNPLYLFFKLSCLTTTLIVIASWLGLLGAMTAGWLPWIAWPYVVVPIALWLILLVLPALVTARRGALTILDAIAMTAEAWLARAGYSVDLNNDGYIGHVQPVTIQPPQEQVAEPVVWRTNSGVQLLTHQVANTLESGSNTSTEKQAAEPPLAARPIQRRVWRCPNGYKVPVETLELFVDQVFDGVRGWSRVEWVPDQLDRDSYDAIMSQLEQAQLIIDRKPRFMGRKNVKCARQARMVLGLSVGEVGSTG